MQRKHIIALSVAAVALIAFSAAASAFITRDKLTEDKPAATAVHTAHKENIHWNAPAQQQQVQRQAPACDDKNIVGTVIGGLGGGVAGSQVGHGNGKTAATIGGTLGGAYLGNEFIPTRNVTCR